MVSENQKIDINKYTDTQGNFSSKELRASEWYVRHRVMLGKIGTGILVAFCIIFNLYALIAWGDYLFFGMIGDAQMEQQVVSSIQNYSRIRPLYQARSLEVSNISSYDLPDNRYNFSARVTNPNTRFIGEITYIFEHSIGETEPQTVIILPGTTMPVSTFGVVISTRPRDVKLTIQKIAWRRINPHVIFDTSSYMEERLKFDFTDFQFIPQSVANNTLSNRITFDIRNKSSYSFWGPTLYVELLNGTQIVGIMQTRVQELIAGETRQVDLRNTLQGLDVTDIKVYPLINVFDEHEFMKAQVTGDVPNLDIDFNAPVDKVTE